MAFVPIRYNWRSLFVRRSSTALTVVSIGATVAVLAAVLALQQGFATLLTERGREDVAVILRTGAGAESESGLSREDSELLIKESPEFAVDAEGRPLASAESYLAVRLRKTDGGETNVPIRGVQQGTFRVHGDDLRVREGGRNFAPGSDEVIVGWRIAERIRNCGLGDTLRLNLTPFKVVGLFEAPGAFESEVWGDAERILAALERPVYSRVIGVLRDGVTAADLQERLAADKRLSVKAVDERSYLSGQTEALSGVFLGLGIFLTLVMGLGAVFTGINAMYSSIAARTREVGILLSTGFRPFAIFVSFLLEAGFLGLLGGIVGVLMVLPLDGVQTGTTNFATFSEFAFSFRITGVVIGGAVAVAVALGVFGGALPAWRAARMEVTTALRRH
ncbi:MAG: ABC transporter permease [Planctomycetes bacterium]|nr:ABC transporter permease [Planctomycetota bacterium]